jgi:hypothetical protein
MKNKTVSIIVILAMLAYSVICLIIMLVLDEYTILMKEYAWGIGFVMGVIYGTIFFRK